MSILLYKPLGTTPLQTIDKYRKLFPQYATITLGAAGRLDPMAEGLLLIMEGEENKNQAAFMGLDKTYVVRMLLGVKTDSFDILGYPTLASSDKVIVSDGLIQEVFGTFTGNIIQKYPPYSAVRVQGKPLFWWAKHNRLDDIDLPSAQRRINSISLESIQTIQATKLLQFITERIALVTGDFRQSEVINYWQQLVANLPNEHAFTTITFKIECSSGTYMRALVHDMGTSLGCGATTLSILRTRVGNWSVDDAYRLPDTPPMHHHNF